MKIDWAQLRKLLGSDNSVFIHYLDEIESCIHDLKSSFPQNSLHTFAIKSNPTSGILRFFVDRGLGLECASIEEVWLALEAGCHPSKILHDGPAKTNDELEYCIKKGVGIVANDRTDLERLLTLNQVGRINLNQENRSRVALRINPISGYGRIRETSVSTPDSKFGLIIEDSSELSSILEEFPFIDGVHVHIGSQGIGLDQLTAGLDKVLKLIHHLPPNRLDAIKWVDIGGGLSVDYSRGNLSNNFSDIAKNISWFNSKHPEIQIVTEYGRALVSTSGIFVSKAEKVFDRNGVQNVIIHGGADAFLRWAYNPKNWWHRISLEGSQNSQNVPTQIHGPLCFSGDKLGKKTMMKKIEVGSLAVIHDAGAYVISMWSKHCNRRRPKVLGVNTKGGVEVLFRGDSKEDILLHW